MPNPDQVKKRIEEVSRMQRIAQKSGLVIRRAAGGYITVSNALLDKWGKEIGPYGIAVYVALARFASNTSASTYVSQNTIAIATGIGRQHVNVILAKLEELKLIAIERRPGTSSIVVLAL